MLITTKQAAARLKVSGGTVRNLMKKGKLHDLSGKEGKYHHAEFDIHEVIELSKVYVNPKGAARKNGTAKKEKDVTAAVVILLDSINSKLDKLVQIWS
jgi:hypothetical protein